jgi:hypothetical protein
MAQNKIEILIIADGKKAHATLVTTGKAAKKFGDDTEQASKTTGNFGKSVLSLQSALTALGLGAVVAQLGNFAIGSFKAAASAERLGAATGNLAQAIGSSGDAMVDAITGASIETISKTDAMTAANKAMMFGLIENSDQMARLTEVAITLGAAMGQDAGKSLDDLTTALGRQSPMILDNLGITLKLEEAYKIYAAQLGKTVEQLTEQEKKQAFVTAALIKGEEKVRELGGVTLDAAGKTEQLSASWEDFTVAFGGLLTQMSGGIETLTGFVRKLEEGAEAWQWVFQARAAVREYHTEMQTAEKVTAEAIDQIAEANDAFMIMSGSTQEATDAAIQHTKEQKSAEMAAGAFTQRLQGLADAYQMSGEAAKETETATIEITEAIQSSAEVHAMTGEAVAQSYKEIGEAAMAAAETAKQAAFNLATETAGHYLSLRELNEDRIQNEADFIAQIATMQGDAAAKTGEAATALSEELATIEQERADKLAWVMDGAHNRTAEQNAEALAHWNAHYDELKTTAETKTKEKTDAILAEQSRAEAAAASAREKEKAEYQAHLDSLKLQTALSMLETTGQLAELTGLVGISASDAADLISAGVLPVTEELGVAMQDTLINLESGMAAAAETSAANQEIIQAAMDGTLTSTEGLGESTTAVFNAMNTQIGTQIPTSINAASTATTAFTVSATEGTNQLTEEAIIPFRELLDILSLETVPLLQSIYLQAFAEMLQATTALVAEVEALVKSLEKVAATVKKLGTIFVAEAKKMTSAFKEVTKAFDDATNSLEDLEKQVSAVAKAFIGMAEAAKKAAAAAKAAGGSPGVPEGTEFQHGTSSGGFLVPSSFGTDEFPAWFSGGERIFAFPNDRVPGRQQTTNYYFNQTVNSRAEDSTVISDFRTMQMLLGV